MANNRTNSNAVQTALAWYNDQSFWASFDEDPYYRGGPRPSERLTPKEKWEVVYASARDWINDLNLRAETDAGWDATP